MNELALFAGAGGGILGGHLLGWRTVCAVEWEPYPASVLAARQNDGLLPAFPIWDDVCTFDGRPWRGIVDVVSGGFPCQDISAAGKGAGIDGERSGMWREMARIVGEVRPRFVFVENSPLLVGRGLAVVLGDLAEMGFDARWGVLGASDVGAPHRRERIWIVGNAVCDGRSARRMHHAEHDGRESGADGKHPASMADPEGQRCGEAREFRCDQSAQRAAGGGESMADADGKPWNQGRPRHAEEIARGRHADRSDERAPELADAGGDDEQGFIPQCADAQGRTGSHERPAGPCSDGIRWWATEPDVGRVAHGVAARVDRLKAIGNGQVPQCAAAAWRILSAAD